MVSLEQIIVTFILVTLIWIGNKYGDSSTKYAYLFFVGGFAGIFLLCYWMYFLLTWIAKII